jgi:hypothetical protein
MDSITEFECVQCGHYFLSDFLKNETAWIRPIMYYCLLHGTGEKTVFFVPNDRDEPEHSRFITTEVLKKMKPNTLNEKIDMIMLNLGRKIKFWGDGYAFTTSGQQEIVMNQAIYSGLILMCDTIMADYNKDKNSITEIQGTLKFLVDYGYLERKGNTNSEYTFTVDGWKYLGKLQVKNTKLPQAFIAMWFSSEMDRARDSIKKAVYDAGYVPVIIDEKEHNNQIVPEMLYEIQRSAFLIADLTGHRNGVYYEAGYAHGL